MSGLRPFRSRRKMSDCRWARNATWPAFPSNQRDKEADLLRRILHNQVPGGPCNWVLMNAALILYAAGKGATWVSCRSRLCDVGALEEWVGSAKV